MNSKIFFPLWMALVLMAGCRKFDKLNTDPARTSETEPRYLLASAEKKAVDLMYHGYYNGRIGMHFAQYWTGTDKTAESRNMISDEGLWAALYTGPLMDLQEIENYYGRHPELRNEHMLAVAGILKAWIFHVLTDLYTDIPYGQSLQADNYPQPMFDKGQDVYAGLLASLEQKVDLLEQSSTADVVTGDILGRGDNDYWIKFANALRMRIAMRMADVRPAEARRIIEDAALHTLEHVADDVYFPYNNGSATSRFPYNEADRPLLEFVMTTTLINYMKQLNDPRLFVYARPDAATGRFRGKPYGQADNQPVIDSVSRPGPLMYSPAAKGYIITYAEVAFLLAEAAARGMDVGGDAAYFYEEGIGASMEQWGITDHYPVLLYMSQVPYEAGNWRNVIGCQKWIALYMQGLQAWMERLRLDFKKPDGTPLFIKPVSGSLDPDVADVPQRLNYPAATRNSNSANVDLAIQHIGRDSKATKNWWDIR